MRRVLQEEVDDLPISELNKILLKVSIYSYFLVSRQELLGIKQDVADLIRQERYNNEYLLLTSGTVANKQAKAEMAAQEEIVASIIYSRAFKILKGKNESVQRLCDSLKKVLSAKMQEAQLANREV